MNQDEFTKLFKYMQDMREEINGRFTTHDKRFDDVTAAVAELGGQLRDYHQELLMMAHKVDRLERWINQIAAETGVKLTY